MIDNSQGFKKIIASSGVNFIFRIFGLFASFLITFIISRLYGIADYGNYALVFTISQATAIIFTLGIPNTLIKIIGNHNFTYKQAKKLLLKGLKITLLLSIFPVAFFYFFSNFLATVIFHNKELTDYFLIITLSLPLFVIHEIFIYFFIATKNFMKYSIFMFVIPNVLLLLFLVLFFYLNLFGYYAFLAFALAILVTGLLEVILVFRIKSNDEIIPYTSITLLKTASPLMFSGLLLYLLNWTDVIILGMMLDDKQVGIYNIAFKVGSAGFLIIVSVSTIITPKIAELYGSNKTAELKNLVHSSTRLIALLSIPVVLVLILFRHYILSFFGTEATPGASTLVIVSLGVLFSAMIGNVDQIMNMTNNQKILRNITAVCFFVNVILNILLIPNYGIEGSAFASLVTNIIINLLCLFYIKKNLGFYTLF
jgi:O-antigen/teichoic acid export membrane protein